MIQTVSTLPASDGAVQGLAVPRVLQIETINGTCTVVCNMCTISMWTRKRHVMATADFDTIIGKFRPYVDLIDQVTFQGFAEPLLDRRLPEKVKIAKDYGFRGTGFATNCTELRPEVFRPLAEAGLDTLICSLDGIRKETHESIRMGSCFEECVGQVEAAIAIRNRLDASTRFFIRFVAQESNTGEWPEYHAYWNARIDRRRGDDILRLDTHNWGGDLTRYDELNASPEIQLQPKLCDEVFDRMMIYSNGDVGLCCADSNGFYEIGNVLQSDPIELFNGQIHARHRTMMQEGRIGELPHCATCSLPRSRALKQRR